MTAEETAAAPGPDPGRFRWRLWLPRAVFESALIVFSVFLGLALSNWNAERADERRVAAVRHAFVQEIRANCRTLASDRFLPHHRRLLAAANGPGAVRAMTQTGVHPMLFREAVWRSVHQSELMTQMELGDALSLAMVYRMQEELAALNRAVYPLLLQADVDDPAVGRTLRLYLSDVVGLEQEIHGFYREVLPLLGGPAAAEGCPATQPNAR